MNISRILNEVYGERVNQDKKWGEQNHPDGTGCREYKDQAFLSRNACDENFKNGNGTYKDIFLEEVYEALAEKDKSKLRKELIQVAAVSIAWIEKLDRERTCPYPGCSKPWENKPPCALCYE